MWDSFLWKILFFKISKGDMIFDHILNSVYKTSSTRKWPIAQFYSHIKKNFLEKWFYLKMPTNSIKYFTSLTDNFYYFQTNFKTLLKLFSKTLWTLTPLKMAMSGVKPTEACMTVYQDIQKAKKHRYVIFLIRDEKQIDVEKVIIILLEV